MHFVDFLFNLLAFFMNALRTIYGVFVEYVLPVSSYILPIISKFIIQITAEFLRIFFNYVIPVLANALRIFLWVLTNVLNSFGSILLVLMDLEIAYVNSQAITVSVIILAIIYFRATERILRFGNEFIQMITLNIRFIWHLLQICFRFIIYLYKRLFKVRTKTTQNDVKIIGTVTEKKSSKKHLE